jgi:hypothetical protein
MNISAAENCFRPMGIADTFEWKVNEAKGHPVVTLMKLCPSPRSKLTWLIGFDRLDPLLSTMEAGAT